MSGDISNRLSTLPATSDENMSLNLAEEQDEGPAGTTWNSGIQKSIDGLTSCATLQQRSGIGKEINLIFSKRKQDEIIRTAR